MKVTLDLTALVAGGQLTEAEAERLRDLAAAQTGSMGANILLGFGMVAVAAGLGVLLPTPQTAIVLGAMLVLTGLTVSLKQLQRWAVLGQIALVIGALSLCGGLVLLADGDWRMTPVLAVGLAVLAVAGRSGLLAALSVLMLAVTLGSNTAYLHASYYFEVERPALNIGVLSALALVLYLASLRLPAAYERLAIIAARTAVLLVNLAFLVGSLWGDDQLQWPALAFTIGWAVVLLAVLVWAVAINRPWLVNSAAVFAAIHFYTQWFETLGASAFSVLGGGLLLIVFGLVLARFNGWLGRRRARPAGP